MKKYIIYSIIAVVVVGGAAFYGGMQYGQNAKSSASNYGGRAFRSNGAFAGANGGMVEGQIVSMDSQSITVSLPTGGSKIIFYSPTTQVRKTTDGSISDLSQGTSIIVSGSQNSDGSITASSIQIRPMPSGQPSISPQK